MSADRDRGSGGRARRVLVLNQFALPRSQGGGTRHVELFGSLRLWSHLVIAGGRNYSTQRAYSPRERGFVTVAVPRSDGGPGTRLLSWACYVVGAVARARRVGPFDVVYASTPHLLTPVAGYLLARSRRVPLVVEVRDLWPQSVASAAVVDGDSATYRLLERLERWVYARADALVAVTPGWEDHFARCGVDRAAVTVVSNGAQVEDFELADDRAQLRREWGISGFTAVFSGTHGPKDGVDLLLDAAGAAPQVRFLLVGSGPAKAAAQARARREGLGNVTFRDPVPKADLPRLLRACDVGIHAVTPLPVFEHGMSPNKLFDYLAAGLPVVSNAEGPLRHVLAQGQCGILGGPHTLAASLERVRRASPAQRQVWGEAGRSLVRERYSRSVQSARLAGVLDSVACGTRATGGPGRGRGRRGPRQDAGRSGRDAVRVAHVSSAHPWTDNRVHLREAASLAQAGFRVDLVAVDSDVEAPPTGVTVHRLPKRARWARVTVNGPHAVLLAMRLRPHVVHLHDPELCWAIPLFRARGAKVVYDAHEDLPKQVLGKDYLGRRGRAAAVAAARAVHRVVRTANLIVVATEGIAAAFPGCDPVVIHNYPRLRRDTDASAGPPAVDDRRLRLVYVGAMSEERGIRVMVQACGEPGFPAQARLHLYGPVRPAALLDELSRLPGWAKVVAHGVVSPDRARRAIREAHVGVVLFGPSPAHVESLPTKMFEYLAEGRPVIASDFPLWREIVLGLDCGVVVDPSDAGAVARAVTGFAQDPDAYARQSRHATEAARGTLNWAREEARLIDAYDRLVGLR